MDNQLNHLSANHHGFIYHNPTYVNPVTYQMPTPNERHHHDKTALPLATIYVRPQVYKGINSPAEALKQGTAFAELYRPFKGGLSS